MPTILTRRIVEAKNFWLKIIIFQVRREKKSICASIQLRANLSTWQDLLKFSASMWVAQTKGRVKNIHFSYFFFHESVNLI